MDVRYLRYQDRLIEEHELKDLLSRTCFRTLSQIYSSSKYRYETTLTNFRVILILSVRQARINGSQIISNANGYKYAVTIEEWKDYLKIEDMEIARKLKRMSQERNESIGHLIKDILSNHISDPNQLKLNSGSNL